MKLNKKKFSSLLSYKMYTALRYSRISVYHKIDLQKVKKKNLY